MAGFFDKFKKKETKSIQESFSSEKLMEQISQWAADGEHQRIIDTIKGLPPGEMDYELAGQLVCALNNTGDFEEAIEVLTLMEPDAAEDFKWHYWKGYALCSMKRWEEAVKLLERAQELAPGLDFIANLIEFCHNRGNRREYSCEYEEIDLNDEEYIIKDLQKILNDVDTEIQNGSLRIPEWRLSIRAFIEEHSEQSAILYYYLNSPEWDQQLFECSVGVGSDFNHAFGTAQGGFVFGILNGVNKLMNGDAFSSVQSSYAGTAHRWGVYQSNLIAMGETPKETGNTQFWNLLKEDILKRIGNQKLCYVKVYGAKNGDQITGECRINDISIPELCQKVADFVQKWDTEKFGSQKQFFFLRQTEETYTSYPYTEQQIYDYTVGAAKLFYECDQEDDYDRLEEKIQNLTKDSSLATELYLFLPEICAESAFERVPFPETVMFQRPGQDSECIYKTQIKSFYAIKNALFSAFDRDAFDGHTNDVYRICALYSASAKIIHQAMEHGENLEQADSKISICFRVGEDYQFR